MSTAMYTSNTPDVVVDEKIYDLVGLGFGPANVALAGALIEKWESGEDTPIRDVLFLEQQEKFRWHPGMLLPGARMQISFMKDLATLRNPGSPITFLSYLHSQNRLLNFINRGTTIPSRKEYADYLGWCARWTEERGVGVKYGQSVVGFREAREGEWAFEVESRDAKTGVITVRRAKNIIMSPGGKAKMPPTLSLLTHDSHPRIIHSSAYVTSIGSLLSTLTTSLSAFPSPSSSSGPVVPTTTRPLRVAVVGCGQSATEVLLDLHARLSEIKIMGSEKGVRHELEMLFRKGSLKPSDDSPFANEIFDPDSTNMLYNLGSHKTREFVTREYKNTNYGVVNPRTIDTLYELVYDQQVDETIAAREGTTLELRIPKLKLRSYTNILSAEASPAFDGEAHDTLTLTLQHLLANDSASSSENPAAQASISNSTYDLVVCGTGYDRTGWIKLIANSNVASRFGLNKSVRTQDVKVCSADEINVHDEELRNMLGYGGQGRGRASRKSASPAGSTDSSAPSTPITPPLHSLAASTELTPPSSGTKLYVSRAYRLMPVEGEEMGGRIYLQGCTEATHGLSDTLLSVMGVKSGEVVADLSA